LPRFQSAKFVERVPNFTWTKRTPKYVLDACDTRRAPGIRRERRGPVHDPRDRIMASFFNFNRRAGTVRSVKAVDVGTRSGTLRKHLETTLGSGTIEQAVLLPQGEDRNEWLGTWPDEYSPAAGRRCPASALRCFYPAVLLRCHRSALTPRTHTILQPSTPCSSITRRVSCTPSWTGPSATTSCAQL